MAGMRKEYDPNKAGRRKRRPIIYIICEGKETETKYFKHFRSRNCKAIRAMAKASLSMKIQITHLGGNQNGRTNNI